MTWAVLEPSTYTWSPMSMSPSPLPWSPSLSTWQCMSLRGRGATSAGCGKHAVVQNFPLALVRWASRQNHAGTAALTAARVAGQEYVL